MSISNNENSLYKSKNNTNFLFAKFDNSVMLNLGYYSASCQYPACGMNYNIRLYENFAIIDDSSPLPIKYLMRTESELQIYYGLI